MPARSSKVEPIGPSKRGRWLMALGVLAALAVGGKFVWDGFATSVREQPRYLVTTDKVAITPPPAWVHRDIKRDVLTDAGLHGTISILDDRKQLHERLNQAFQFHPWVRSVERIELQAPATVQVELTYRKPLAAIELVSQEQILLVVDSDLIRLPEMDLSEAEKRHLPRIRGITNRPLVGEAWSDPRVAGAVQLLRAFGDSWSKLYLVDLVPSEFPEVRGSNRYYVFQLVTECSTQIDWGAPPGQEPPGESSFDEKLKQLKSYVMENGPLNSIHTPETISLRQGIIVHQRTVKQLEPVNDEGKIR